MSPTTAWYVFVAIALLFGLMTVYRLANGFFGWALFSGAICAYCCYRLYQMQQSGTASSR